MKEVHDHDAKEAGKKTQQVVDEAWYLTGKTSSPGNGKQQKNVLKTGARLQGCSRLMQSLGIQNQILLSKMIGFSNSFDALVNEREHDAKEAGNKMQQIDDEAGLITGKTNSSGRGVQQQISKELGARLYGSTEIVSVDALNVKIPGEAVPMLQFSNPVRTVCKGKTRKYGDEYKSSDQATIGYLKHMC